jgi:hypothetical protein
MRVVETALLKADYDRYQLRYLAGLRCLRQEDKVWLTHWPEEQFNAFPPTDD